MLPCHQPFEEGSALITAAGGVISQLLANSSQSSTNKMNLQIQRENNQFNKEMMEENQAWQEKMWNNENAYNTPTAQRQRLEAAGLNPYLMMDGGSSGTAGSVGSVSTASSGASGNQQPNDYSILANLAPQIIQAEQAEKQNEKLRADTELTEETAKGLRISNAYKNAKEQWELLRLIKDTDNKDLQNEGQAIYNRLQALQESFLEDTEVDRRNKVYYESQNEFLKSKGQEIENQMNDERLKMLPKQLKQEFRNLVAEYYVLVSQKKLNEDTASYYISMKALDDAKKAGVDIDNDIAAALKEISIIRGDVELEQAQKDLNNPFRYIGGLFSGSVSVGKVFK